MHREQLRDSDQSSVSSSNSKNDSQPGTSFRNPARYVPGSFKNSFEDLYHRCQRSVQEFYDEVQNTEKELRNPVPLSKKNLLKFDSVQENRDALEAKLQQLSEQIQEFRVGWGVLTSKLSKLGWKRKNAHEQNNRNIDYKYQRLKLSFQRELTRFEQRLPMYAKRTQLLQFMKPSGPNNNDNTINNNNTIQGGCKDNVLILIGETGSGKSTQPVQYLLEAGLLGFFNKNTDFPRDWMIGITQPRKVAVLSLAKRVSQEFLTEEGEDIGWELGTARKISHRTRVKFMSDRVLLNEICGYGKPDRRRQNPEEMDLETSIEPSNLDRYSCIIVDEAHERTIFTDLLLCMLKQCVQRRARTKNPLKLIITSATLNAELFSNYFDNCPVLRVPGQVFPVEIIYKPLQNNDNYVDACVDVCTSIIFNKHRNQNRDRNLRYSNSSTESNNNNNSNSNRTEDGNKGDILVFLTGLDEIEKAINRLDRNLTRSDESLADRCILLPLHGQLRREEQQAVFDATPPGKTKVIFATNIAQTSVTIDGVKFVVDPGMTKESVYDVQKNISMRKLQYVTQSAAVQRKGRAGRTCPGVCYRLYSEQDYNQMAPSQLPEILRTHLGLCLLKLKELGIMDIHNFDFIEKPANSSISDALESLKMLGALDAKGVITPVGKQMSQLGMEPSTAKMVLKGIELGCGQDVVIIAGMLVVSNFLFYRATDEAARSMLDSKKVAFSHPGGDLLTARDIYIQWKSFGDQYQASRWAKDNSINMKSLKIADEVVEEITKTLSDMNFGKLKLAEKGEQTNIQLAICSAFYHNLCVQNGVIKDRHFDEIPVYTIIQLQENATIFTGSSVTASETPKWFVYQEFVKTANAKSMLKNITPIDPGWLKAVCPPQYLPKFNVENIQQKVLQSFELKMIPAIFQALKLHDIAFLEQQTNSVVSLNKHQHSIIVWTLPSEWNQIQKVLLGYFGMIKERLAKEVTEVVVAGKTRALVGPGGSVIRILLPTESVRVIITNIPIAVDTNIKYHAMFKESFQQYGTVLSLEIRSDSSQCWGSVTYQEPDAVARAVENMNGKSLDWFPPTEDPHFLSVKPEASPQSKQILSFQNNVTAYWKTGKTENRAYITFETVEQAVAATHDPILIRNYSPRFDSKHGRDKNSNTVLYLSRLPTAHTDEFDIKAQFGRHGRITNCWVVTKPSEDQQDWSSPDAMAILKGIFENFGEVELFEVVPPSAAPKKKSEFTGKAYIRYKDTAGARRAVSELEGKLNVFGTGKLHVKSDFSYDFTLTGFNYKILSPHIKSAIEVASEKCKGCRITIKSHREDMVLVRVQGNAIADIVEGKSYLDQVLQSEAVPMAEGVNAKYFLSSYSRGIQDIQRKYGVCVQFDKRSNSLQLIGPPTQRRASAGFLKHLSSPSNNNNNSNREKNFTITLPKGSLKAIIGRNGKGLFLLQKQYRVEANLVIPKHLILVKSTEDNFQAFKKAIDDLIQNFITKPKDQMDKEKEEEDCGICFCELTQPHTLLCGHTFCRDCLSAQIKNSLHSTEFPINCVTCNVPIALSDLFAIASSDELRKLNQGAVRAYLFLNKNYSNCLTPDCPQIYSLNASSEDFICDVCMRHYCVHCKVQYHLGITCEEQQRILNSDKEFEEWKKKNTKPCGKCGTAIQKNGGCNHMACAVCKNHFCWFCGFSSDNSTPIYTHLRETHGGIYDE